MPFLKEPLSLPQKKLNQLPPYAKTHKELELASQLGDADSSVQLGELWKEELANTMDSIGKAHEAQENMRTWYKQAAEEGHPLAKLRLAQMENPDLMDKPAAEPARTLLNDCLAKAASGDFITLRGISEYVTPEQWEELTASLRKKAQEGDARSQADLAYLMLFSYRSEESRAIRKPWPGPGFPPDRGILRHVRAGPRPYLRFGLEKRMAEGDSWMFRGALKGHVDAADMWSSNNENLQPYSAMMHGLAARGHIPSLLFLANQAAYPQDTAETAAQNASRNTSHPAYQQVKMSLNSEEGNTPPWLRKPGQKDNAEDTLTDAGAVPPWMTPSGRERQAPAPKTINPEAVKFWEQAVELGSLTALDELANYYETVAGNVQDPAERQQAAGLRHDGGHRAGEEGGRARPQEAGPVLRAGDRRAAEQGASQGLCAESRRNQRSGSPGGKGAPAHQGRGYGAGPENGDGHPDQAGTEPDACRARHVFPARLPA